MRPLKRALKQVEQAIREATSDGRHYGGRSFGVEHRWRRHLAERERADASTPSTDSDADRRA